jgi:DNA-binding phage protein
MESEPLVSGREERAQALLDAIEAGDAAAVADALDACTGMGGMAEED